MLDQKRKGLLKDSSYITDNGAVLCRLWFWAWHCSLNMIQDAVVTLEYCQYTGDKDLVCSNVIHSESTTGYSQACLSPANACIYSFFPLSATSGSQMSLERELCYSLCNWVAMVSIHALESGSLGVLALGLSY